MKMRTRAFIAASALAWVAGTLSTLAATNYWDNNAAEPGFGAAGGTWGAEKKWSIDPTGASLPGTIDTTTADDLHFGTASNGLTTGTVTVDGSSQGFNTITIGEASGAITLSGGTLNLATPASRILAQNASNTIATVLAGNGALNKFGALTHTAFLTTNAATIFPNVMLSDYEGASGVIGGGFVGGGGAAIQGYACFYTNNGIVATYQLQILDGVWTKCAKVELTQVGADIAARVLYAKYIDNGRVIGYDFDAGGNAQVVATSYAAGGYGVAETTLTANRIHSTFLTADPVTIFPNATLSDYRGADGRMGGAYVLNGVTPAEAYYFSNDGSTATYQLQAENGGYTKCVKVELTQTGADIAARVIYAKYTNPGNLGFNFDTGGNNNFIATSFSEAGYGAAQTILVRFKEDTVLTLTGANTYSGHTIIGGGPLVIGGAGQLAGGAYAGMILNSGGFQYESSEHQALSGAITSVGPVIHGIASDYVSTNYPSFLTGSAKTVFTNAALSNYLGAAGIMGGASVFHSRPFVADTYFFTNDGSVATYQLQIYDGGHTKCAKVELKQTGTNIEGLVVYAKYLLNQNALGFDFDTGGNGSGIATSWTAGGYGAAETTLMTHPNPTLTLSAANSYSGGTVVHRGVLKAIGTASAIGAGGGIVVNRGGELRLEAPGLAFNNWGGVGNGNPITVNGGILTLANVFNAGYGRAITLNGGLLRSMNTAWEDGGDNANYINNLTLRDGAQVIGHPIRVGYHSAATITVAGTNASSLAAGMRLVNGGNRPLTLDVADVTADTNTDFTVSGVVWDYASLEGMPIIKTGDGTVTFSAANTYAGVTTITSGTLALGTNSALAAGAALVLNGGALDMGMYSNAIGTLTVSTNSLIRLDAGQLAFADSSAMSWTGSLTLTGKLGPQTVRFGNSSTALTSVQLQGINLDGSAVYINESGYLSTQPGTVLIVR